MIKVLELFAGIGACSTALGRLGIEHEIVDAVEIDKYAMASFNAIHGTNFEPQDITTWDKDIECDLIMHGSPCQDISVAGQQAGADENSGTRSSLMYETIRIVEKLKPKYVIWENVKNLLSKKHRHNFGNYLERMENMGYRNYYQVLNAKDYGIPQNRERVFTISIQEDIDFFHEFHFPEKEELKLRLKDMLEEQVDEKYYLAGNQIERMKTTSYVSGGFEKRVRQGDGICSTLAARDFKDPKCVQIGILDIKGQDNIKRVYSDDGLSPTLTDMQGGNRQPKIIASTQAHASIREDGITPTLTTAMGLGGGQVPMVEEPFIVASRGRNPENPSSREPGIHTEQRLEPNTRGITNTITSVQKDNYVATPKKVTCEYENSRQRNVGGLWASKMTNLKEQKK